MPVSYTHLDVYKRQLYDRINQRVLMMMDEGLEAEARSVYPVSYTHLDVYKRQFEY